MRLFLLFWCLFCLHIGFAQTDSVSILLSKITNDSNSVNNLNRYSQKIWRNEPTQARHLGEKALEIAKQIEYPRGEAYSYISIALSYNTEDNYVKMTEFYVKAMNVFTQIQDKRGLARTYNGMGIAYSHEKEELEKANEYFEKYIKLNHELQDLEGVAIGYNNIGDNYKSHQYYRQAIAYFHKSIKLSTAIGFKRIMATATHNLGELYLLINHWDSASHYSEKAKSLLEEVENKRTLSSCYVNLGYLYFKKGEMEGAEYYLSKGLEMSLNLHRKENVRNAYKYLVELAESKKDLAKALEYQKKFQIYQDSIHQETDIHHTQLLRLQFETDKKQNQYEILLEQQQQLRLSFYVALFGLLIILLLAILSYRNYVRQKVLNELLDTKNREVERVNRDVQKQNQEIKQTNEELEKQREQLLLMTEDSARISDQLIVTNQELEQTKIQLEVTLAKELKNVVALEQAYTDLKYTQVRLAQTDKMAAIGLLTAGIAHEIKNPINFISAGMQSLQQNLQEIFHLLDEFDKLNSQNVSEQLARISKLKRRLDYDYLREDVGSLVSHIQEGVTRTTEIIKSLRGFSRADDAFPTIINLHDNINSTLVLLKPQYKDRIEIVKNFDEHLPTIKAFSGQVNQVLMNILANAMEAIENEGKIQIQTKTIQENQINYVRVSITDSGQGMTEEVKAKLFKQMFTTKEGLKGTGLGLTLCFEIMKKHNGKIEVESEFGKGSTFHIDLPIEV